jgi:GR25 family glycosyltransferase involved in LPS biosynthesis|tara:strand:+ start:51 stop:749 length:699 start_codon:yes stop_codon:yes gene_type:complete
MKAFCITVKNNTISESGFNACWQSCREIGNNFNVERFDATDHYGVASEMINWDLFWNYPWEGKVSCIATGLIKSAYPTAVKTKRMAAAVSHFRLWTECFETKEPIIVLEHDAFFIKKLDYQYILDSKYDIIGINNPLGATRRAQAFHDIIKKNKKDIQPVPTIDEFNIPQGLAGNSAYIIKPSGAEKMIELVFKYGLWPNDALMCKQLVDKIGVTKTFYTRVQGLTSTTTQH